MVQGQDMPSVLVDHYTTARVCPPHCRTALWRPAAVLSGLARESGAFDGNAFTRCRGLIASDPAPRKVETLVEDSCGNLWIRAHDWKLLCAHQTAGTVQKCLRRTQAFLAQPAGHQIQADGRGGVLPAKIKTLLLAHTDRHGQTHVRLLVDARAFVNPYDHRLARSVVQLKYGTCQLCRPEAAYLF